MSHPTWRSWAPIRITIQTLVVRRARAFSKRHVRQKPLEVKIAPSRRSRPVAGGSTVGLSATDAWDKAAAGDAATMRLSGTDGELKPAIATIKCSQWKRFGGSQGAASLTRPSHWYREGRLSLVMSLRAGGAGAAAAATVLPSSPRHRQSCPISLEKIAELSLRTCNQAPSSIVAGAAMSATKRPVHPVAALFPMMTDEELANRPSFRRDRRLPL
jgi:hypothetical protein